MGERIGRSIVLTVALTLTMTGCTVPELPTYETVTEEANAAMQRVVDEMPPGSRVGLRPETDPYGCDGDSVLYTGHWGVYPGGGFDGQAFVDQLPTALGDGFVVRDSAVKLNKPSVGFTATAYGNASLDVSVVDVDGTTLVDILAISRCAQPPSSPTP
ncbi:hypothetical protein [Microbacterium sp. SLBN-111]|uniref:hypothetical protein n=1 Tax=Microbacterium sp. SLBN-111 TaxID=3377733 RepID=UPI003C70CBB6